MKYDRVQGFCRVRCYSDPLTLTVKLDMMSDNPYPVNDLRHPVLSCHMFMPNFCTACGETVFMKRVFCTSHSCTIFLGTRDRVGSRREARDNSEGSSPINDVIT